MRDSKKTLWELGEFHLLNSLAFMTQVGAGVLEHGGGDAGADPGFWSGGP